ncbi:MAG: hypothetical protein IPM79_14180 [Polyangiaceae bacterium]|nr:hypothetical protein [Polyangiaceae bacterium]
MSQPKTTPTASPSRHKAGSSVAPCTTRRVTVKLRGGKGYGKIHVRVENEAKEVEAGGRATFDAMADKEGFDLVITVPRPGWAGPGVKDEPPNEVIRTRVREVAPCRYLLEPRHVRLTVRATGPFGAKEAATEIEVDLRFLRVTRYFRSPDPNYERMVAEIKKENPRVPVGEDAVLGPLDPEFNDPTSKKMRFRTPLANVELFELTTGVHPKLWAATWPMGMPLTKTYARTLFLMPKGVAYEHPGQARFGSLQRYLVTPARDCPFFVWVPIDNGNMGMDPLDLSVPVQSNEKYGPHPLANEMQIKEPNIPGAFIDQIVESGKSVMAVLPLPNGAGGGVWDQLDKRAGWAEEHLEALRVAAHALMAPAEPLSKIRQSVGGFSAGAPPAYLVLTLNPKAFDGFFWFDVPRNSDAQQAWLRSWIDGDPARKMWLIGGDHYPELEVARKNIDRNKNVTLFPSSGAHYTSKTAAYARGLSEPPACPHWVELRLEPSPTGKRGGVHHATGVFGDVAGTMEIKLKIEDGGATVTRTARASEREALGLLVFKFRIRDGFKHVKVTTKSDLEQLVEFIETDVEVLRHQWVIGGGETLGERGRGFVSFFGECIRQWAR